MFSPRPANGLVARAVTGAVVALAALAPATGAAAAAPPTTVVDYVALGDSYAAGVGAGTETGACRTTDAAYGALWANDRVDLTLAACSGATSADVLGQLGALDAKTDLVSVTVGANDLKLVDTLRTCAAGAETPACATALAAIPAALSTTAPAGLAKLMGAIRTQAPQATIAVIGYPTPFAGTADCGTLPLPAPLRTAGNQAVAALNQLLAAQAKAAGAVYVDVQQVFAGHELCTAAPWLVGAEGLSDSTVLHPTRTGQDQGYRAAFTTQVGTVEDIFDLIAGPGAGPTPSASTPASPVPSASGPASSAPVTAAPAPGAGGGDGNLPVTGPGIGAVAALGALLVGAGVGTFLFRRARRMRFVSE